MKVTYPVYSFIASFNMPDSDTIYEVKRELEDKDALRREIESLGGENIKIRKLRE